MLDQLGLVFLKGFNKTDPLLISLPLSLILHASVFYWVMPHFTQDAPPKVSHAKTFEITLLNFKSEDKAPEKIDLLSQANVKASGSGDKKSRPMSKAPQLTPILSSEIAKPPQKAQPMPLPKTAIKPVQTVKKTATTTKPESKKNVKASANTSVDAIMAAMTSISASRQSTSGQASNKPLLQQKVITTKNKSARPVISQATSKKSIKPKKKTLEITAGKDKTTSSSNQVISSGIKKQSEATDIKKDFNKKPTELTQNNSPITEKRDERRKEVTTDNTLSNDVDDILAQIANIEAELGEQTLQETSGPKIRYIDTLAAKSVPEAEYLVAWAKHVEKIGLLYLPKLALNKKLSGSLIMQVIIDRKGQLLSQEILIDSGEAELDAGALRIIKLSAPFPPLPTAITDQWDQLSITRNWVFHGGDIQTVSTK